jgi:hypothetical protein
MKCTALDWLILDRLCTQNNLKKQKDMGQQPKHEEA